MTALPAGTHVGTQIGSQVGSQVGTRDQASRLRALVEAMSEDHTVRGSRAVAPPAPAHDVPVVAISSGKGGVGKTNLAVNLAIALTSLGRRITLLDADLGMANADVLCGLAPGRRLDALLRDDAIGDLSTCIVDAPGGFLLVPGAVGVARVAELTAQARARLLSQLATLESRSDAILIDTGAGIGRDVLTFASAADLLIVVATPEPTSITDAYGLIKCVHNRPSHRPTRMALVVNNVSHMREIDQVAERLDGACRQFLGCRLPVLGGIRRDAHVWRAVRARRPHQLAWPRAKASRDIARLADGIEWH